MAHNLPINCHPNIIIKGLSYQLMPKKLLQETFAKFEINWTIITCLNEQ